jgi:hypothetical protein
MFDAGSAVFTLTGRVVREPFESYGKLVEQARTQKEHTVALGARTVSEGFEKFAGMLTGVKDASREAALSVKGSMDSIVMSINKAVVGAERDLTAGSNGIKKFAESFASADESARAFATNIKADTAAAAESIDKLVEEQTVAKDKFIKNNEEMLASNERVARGGGGGKGGGIPPVVTGGGGAGGASEQAAKKTTAAWKEGFTTMANMGKWVTASVAIIGGVSIKAAADFQRQMELIHTQVGYTDKQVKTLSKDVLNLAPAVGVGPTELAKGLYHVTSVLQGQGGTNAAMQILKLAAEGAKVGMANLEDVSSALMAIYKSSPRDIHSVTEAMGVMNDIVGQGNLRMEDLSKALSTGLLAAMNAAHLGLRDVGAALDTMTSRGVPAEQAATRLRTTLTLMAAPTGKAQKALAELGMSSTQLASDMQKKGLVGALQDLQEHLDKTFPPGRKLTVDEERKALMDYGNQLQAAGVHGKALQDDLSKFDKQLKGTGSSAILQSQLITQAFGGSRMGTTMALLMQNADDVHKRFDNLNKANAAGRFNDAWHHTQKDFSVQVSQMWAGVQKLGIQLGDKLIPILKKFVDVLIDVGKWLGHHKVLADALAVAFGTLLVGAVAAFFARLIGGAARGLKSIYKLGEAIAKLPVTFAKAIGLMDGKTVTVTEEVVQEGGKGATAAGAAGTAGEATGLVEGMITGVGGTMAPGSPENPIMVMWKGMGLGQTGGAKSAIGGPIGVFGPTEAGGKNNPIAVIVMASEIFGQGARGAAAEAKTGSQMAAESQLVQGRGAQSVGAPASRTFVAGETGPAAEVPAGMAAKDMPKEELPPEVAASEEAAGGKSMLGGVGKAGVVGMAGFMGAQMLGSAVGGKAGDVITGIGGGAATGAALGSIIPGAGTAVGAVAGGAIGALLKIPGALNAVKKAFSDVVGFIKSNLGISSKDISNFVGDVEKFFKGLVGPLSKIWNDIKGGFSGLFQALKGVFEIFKALFTGDWGKLWKGIKDVFGGIAKEIANEFKLMWTVFTTVIKTIGKVVVALAEGVWKLIKGAFMAGVHAVEGVVNGIVGIVKGAFNAALKGAETIIHGAKKGIVDAAKAVVGGLGDAWHVVTHTIPNAISDGFNTALHFVEGLPGKFARLMGNVVSAIGGAFKGLGQDILGVIKSAVNTAIIDPLNWVIDRFNGLPFVHGFHVGPIHVPGIPKVGHIGQLKQSGGFVDGPNVDNSTFSAAGGELVVTAHGQQMMEQAQPGLVTQVARNQLPHPQTGPASTNASTETGSGPGSTTAATGQATAGFNQLGSTGTNLGKQLMGVGSSAKSVTKAIAGLGTMSSSVEKQMSSSLKKVNTDTETGLKQVETTTIKHTKGISKIHQDFGKNLTQNTWNTFGGPDQKATKGSSTSSITATVTGAWNNLEKVTTDSTNQITKTSQQAQKTDLTNVQNFGKSYTQTAQQTAHNVVDANVKLAQSVGNVLGQVDDQTYSGIKNIFDQLNKGLSAVGASASVKLSGVSSASQDINKALAGLNKVIPFAAGGVLPGSEFGLGDQMTLVDPMGIPRAKMAGDEAIFNRHQMPYVEAGLQMLGFQGAQDLWNTVTTPHGFAQGGKLPGAHPSSTSEKEPNKQKHISLPHRLNAVGQLIVHGDLPKLAVGGYVWPYGPGITSGRIDEGWDMAGTGPIAAIGNTGPLQQGQSGWPGTGQGFYYQLKDGIRAGQYVYVYENVQRLKPLGYQAKAGEILANLLPGYPYLESGWSTSTGAPTAQTHYSEGVAEPEGYDFQRFLLGLAHGKLIGGGTAFGGAAWPGINQPKIKTKGHLGDIARGAMKKMTNAANKYGQDHTPQTGLGGVSGSIGPVVVGADLKADIIASAKKYGIPPSILAGVAEKETSMGTDVNTSSAGAEGVFQFIASTAASYNYPYTNSPSKQQLAQQADSAAHLLSDLYHQHGGDWAAALSAYSGGAYSSVPTIPGFARGGVLKYFASGGNPWSPLPSYAGTIPGFRPPLTRRGTSGLHTRGKSVGTKGGSKSRGKPGKGPGGKSVTYQRPKQTLTQSVSDTLASLGLGNFDADQNQLGHLDTLYTNQENLFQMFDGAGGSGLPLEDLDVLMGIREQQWDILDTELQQLPAAIDQLNNDVAALAGHNVPKHTVKKKVKDPKTGKMVTKTVTVPASVQGGVVPQLQNEIKQTENEIAALKKDVTNETRAAATVRHDTSGELQSLADKYASATSGYLGNLEAIADAKTNNSKKRVALNAQIRNASGGGSSGAGLSLSQIVSGVMSGALPSSGVSSGNKTALQNQVTALQNNDLQLTSLEHQIRNRIAALKQQKDAAARQFRAQGFDEVWAITLKKWRLQDKITSLNDKLKRLKDQLKAEQAAEKNDKAALQQVQDWMTGGTQGTGSVSDSLSAIVFDMLGLYQQGANLPTPGRSEPTMQDLTDFLSSQGLQIPSGLTQASAAALQSAQDFNTFQQSRAQLFTQFGSNFLPAGVSPLTNSANLGAGIQFFGAGAGSNPGANTFGATSPGMAGGGWLDFPPWGPMQAGDTTINIHQNFAAGPPDPHTYSAGLVHELGAMT